MTKEDFMLWKEGIASSIPASSNTNDTLCINDNNKSRVDIRYAIIKVCMSLEPMKRWQNQSTGRCHHFSVVSCKQVVDWKMVGYPHHASQLVEQRKKSVGVWDDVTRYFCVLVARRIVFRPFSLSLYSPLFKAKMPAAGASSGLARTVYNTFFKRNSVYVTTIFASAIAFEMGFDTVTDKVWDDLNKGVSILVRSVVKSMYRSHVLYW